MYYGGVIFLVQNHIFNLMVIIKSFQHALVSFIYFLGGIKMFQEPTSWNISSFYFFWPPLNESDDN